jgi:hypothetical protein
VLDAVPFTGAGRQMAHGDGDPEFIGQHAVAIAAEPSSLSAAVSLDG